MSSSVLLRLTLLSLCQARLGLDCQALFGLYFHAGYEIGLEIILGVLYLMLGNSNDVVMWFCPPQSFMPYEITHNL